MVVALAVLGGWAFFAEVRGPSADAPAAPVRAVAGVGPAAVASVPGTTVAPAATVGPLPATLAGLLRSSTLTGAAALQEVEELHGKALGAGLDGAWVAQYGDGQATLWVSRSVELTDAQQMLDRMTAKIEQAVAEGRSPFTAPWSPTSAASRSTDSTAWDRSTATS